MKRFTWNRWQGCGAEVFSVPHISGRAVSPILPFMTTKCDTLQPPAPRLLYSRSEAARQLSISIRSLDYLIANKAFQTKRIGKKVLITHASLIHFARADHFGPVAGIGNKNFDFSLHL
jgi:hypothetical protein